MQFDAAMYRIIENLSWKLETTKNKNISDSYFSFMNWVTRRKGRFVFVFVICFQWTDLSEYELYSVGDISKSLVADSNLGRFGDGEEA